MGLSDEMRDVIVSRELFKAEDSFKAVIYCAEVDIWSTVANRLYYAMFHAISALLVSDGHYIKSHRAIISQFGLYYVKPRLFSVEEGRLLSNVLIMRDRSDYNTFFEGDAATIAPLIEPVRAFIDKVRQYIDSKSGQSNS